MVEAKGVPLIGPFTLRPGSASPPLRNVFYLHSGLEDQARALATAGAIGGRAGLGRHPYRRPGLDPRRPCGRRDLGPRRRRLRAGRRPREQRGNRPRPLVARLAARRTEVVAYLGPHDLDPPLLDAAIGPPGGRSHLPAALARRDLFDSPRPSAARSCSPSRICQTT